MRQRILKADRPEGRREPASRRVEQHRGIEGITLADLSAKWNYIVEALQGEGVKVVNPGHALEGALSIRYAGHQQVCCYVRRYM